MDIIPVPKPSNRRIVLGILYNRQQLTKRELAEESGLSLPTVTQTVRELTEMGLVTEAGLQESTGGRRAAVSSICTGSRISVGISITRHHVRFALLDLGREVLAKAGHNMRFSDTAAYWEDVRARMDAFLNYNGLAEHTHLSVGISFPGIVDKQSFTLEFAPTLRSGSLRLSRLRTLFGENVMVDNDAVLAAKAEIWFKPLAAPAVYLLLNRGVGGALITKDPSPFGPRAGEFGHMIIEKDGRPCECGNRGCFETYCSSGVIADRYDRRTLEVFFHDLDEGNERCREIWEDYLSHLVVGIHNLRCIFDCSVIIGGEMTAFIEERATDLDRRLTEMSIFTDERSYVRMSNYGEFDSAIGAALLGIERFIESV